MILARTDDAILGVFSNKQAAISLLELEKEVDDGLWMRPDHPNYGVTQVFYYYDHNLVLFDELTVDEPAEIEI